MLDFKELPEDGTAFEQLLREMFLAYEMAVLVRRVGEHMAVNTRPSMTEAEAV